MKKALFLVDAVVSSTYILLLLLLLYKVFILYKASAFNYALEEKVWTSLLMSNNDYARNVSGNGSICILRYLSEKKVFCYEEP